MANLFTAYLCWAVGGLWGLHHLYLERYCHAFTWLATGAGFGLGWLWDFCELSIYVDEKNNVYSTYRSNATKRTAPPCTTMRFLGQLILGLWLGSVTTFAVPIQFWSTTWGATFGAACAALGVAWGVFVVGNIGAQKRNFLHCWLGSWIGCFLTMVVFGNNNSVILGTLASAITCNRTAEWRKRPPPISLKTFMVWVLLYWSLWMGAVSYNIRITTSSGRIINLKQAVGEFLDEYSTWRESHNESTGPFSFEYYFEEYSETRSEKIVEDFFEFVKHFLESRTIVSPAEADKAYKVLDLNRGNTRSEIRSRCRKLLKEAHPDKSSSHSADRFLKIQQACEILAPRVSSKVHDEF